MPAPTITALPTAPQRTDSSSVFSARADAHVAALDTWTDEINAFGAHINGLGLEPGDTLLATNNLSDLANAATALANLGGAPDLLVPAVVSGTSYIIQDTDRYAAKRLTNAAGCSVVVPLNATEAVPIGARIRFGAEGAGGAAIDVEDPAVTLISRDDAVTALEGGIFELHKVATDTWWVLGDVA